MLLEDIPDQVLAALAASVDVQALGIEVLPGYQANDDYEELDAEVRRAMGETGLCLIVELAGGSKLDSEVFDGFEDVLVSVALLEETGTNRGANWISPLKIIRLVRAAVLRWPASHYTTSQQTFRAGDPSWETRKTKQRAIHRINFEITLDSQADL